MYKVAFFDENNVFSHVLTRINDLITNDTSNDLYCYIQIEKSELSYANRFNIMAYDCNEETEARKPFIPYIGLNSNNIDFNIKEYDLNDSLKSRIPNFPNIEFELGTINAQYGLNTPATHRARTKIYNFYLKGNMIHPIDDTVVYNIALYDNNYKFIKTTGWIKGRDYIFNNEIARIMIKYDNDNDINDINSLKNKFIFTGNLNNFYDTLKNYGMSNFTNYINYTGDRIILENKARYNKLDFNSMYQDACCYNEYMFIFNNEGKFYIRNLKENTSTPIYNLDQNDNIKPHCNTVFFGKEKYSNDDLFPILYVNAYNTQNLPLGTLYAHRVMYDSENDYYYTLLIQTITIGFTNNEIWTIEGDIRPYGNFILDTDNNKLYAFTLRGNNTRFFKFNMPEISSGNSVTLNQSDILDMFDLDYFPYIQGTLYINNMLLCLSGNNAILDNSSCLHVVDLVNQKEINKINLSSVMSEPEAITYYNDYLYIKKIL